MPKDRTAECAEKIVKYQKIMKEYQDVSVASLNLAKKTETLMKDPDVKSDSVKEYCRLLRELKAVEKKMMDQFCSEMMEDLIDIGVDVFERFVKEGGTLECTCGKNH